MAAQSTFWRKGKKGRADFRAALRARLDKGDPSAKAEEAKLMQEAEAEAQDRSESLSADWLLGKAKKARKDMDRQRWEALDSKDYRLANRMYVADQDEAAANADKTNFETYLGKRDKDDFEKEIEYGKKRAMQKKVANYRATGHMPGDTSVQFLEKLKKEREEGVTKTDKEVQEDIKKLSRLLLKEKYLKAENPPEQLAEAMVTRQEAAEEADIEAQRKMGQMEESLGEARDRKVNIKRRVLDAEGRKPFTREDDYIDRLEKDAEKKRSKVWVPPEKKAKERSYYRRQAISRKLDDRSPPKDWEARQKREDAKLLGARNRN